MKRSYAICNSVFLISKKEHPKKCKLKRYYGESGAYLKQTCHCCCCCSSRTIWTRCRRLSHHCLQRGTWSHFHHCLLYPLHPHCHPLHHHLPPQPRHNFQVLPVTIFLLLLSAIVRLNAALLDDVVQVEIPAQQDFGSTFYPAHRHLAIKHIFHGQISVN